MKVFIEKLLPPKGFHKNADPAIGVSFPNGSRSGFATHQPIRSIKSTGDSHRRPAGPVECAGQNACNIMRFLFSKAWRALDGPSAPQLGAHLKHFRPADDGRTLRTTMGTELEVLPAPKEIDKYISEAR